MFWSLTLSDTNRAVQLQKMARSLNFRILQIEGLYCLCSENKGADQLRGYREADLRLYFANAKRLFSHDAAQIDMIQREHMVNRSTSFYSHVHKNETFTIHV